MELNNDYIENLQIFFILLSRLFWTIAILCSLTCCILLFRDLIVKVLKNPVIVQQPDTPVSVKNVSHIKAHVMNWHMRIT